jgi:hypothetical protein
MPEWKRESVTGIMEDYVDLAMIPPDRLAFAGERGDLVHRVVASLLVPEKHTDFIPQALVMEMGAQGFIRSFEKWKTLMIEETYAVEEEIFCDCFHFVGHVDWIGRLKGEKPEYVSITDWKTPIQEGKTWYAQVGAYRHLVECHWKPQITKIGLCGPVRLHPRGNVAKFHNDRSHIATNAFTFFLQKLNADRYFEKKERRKR